MEYEDINEYTCKSTLGFGITMRWMKGLLMMMEMMMMKIDAEASKI